MADTTSKDVLLDAQDNRPWFYYYAYGMSSEGEEVELSGFARALKKPHIEPHVHRMFRSQGGVCTACYVFDSAAMPDGVPETVPLLLVPSKSPAKEVLAQTPKGSGGTYENKVVPLPKEERKGVLAEECFEDPRPERGRSTVAYDKYNTITRNQQS